jgi:hypothetical protein
MGGRIDEGLPGRDDDDGPDALEMALPHDRSLEQQAGTTGAETTIA